MLHKLSQGVPDSRQEPPSCYKLSSFSATGFINYFRNPRIINEIRELGDVLSKFWQNEVMEGSLRERGGER